MPRTTQVAIARRPWIKNQNLAIVVGLVALAVGALVLYDAWERRGGKPPLFLRPFLPV